MPKTNAEKQRDHYRRMKEAGFRKVCVYVPAEKADEVKEVARKLRGEKE